MEYTPQPCLPRLTLPPSPRSGNATRPRIRYPQILHLRASTAHCGPDAQGRSHSARLGLEHWEAHDQGGEGHQPGRKVGEEAINASIHSTTQVRTWGILYYMYYRTCGAHHIGRLFRESDLVGWIRCRIRWEWFARNDRSSDRARVQSKSWRNLPWHGVRTGYRAKIDLNSSLGF